MTSTEVMQVAGRRPEPMSERVVVRCFDDYREAKRAVDALSVARIPRTRITLVGRGLHWREPFTRDRLLKLAAGAGAALGVAAALALWALGALDSGFTWLGAVAAGAALGTVLGLVMGAVSWPATRRRTSVPETGHVDADHYDVLVELALAERARRLLDG